MKEGKNKNDLKWYDSGSIITSLIVGVIALIIICSQSFAFSGDTSLTLFGSIINHNSIYLLVVIYFIFLKLRFGKKYFNYLNVFLIFIYLLVTLTSLLTLVQSFSLNTTLSFILNFVFLIYLFHTMFRDTRIWKDFNLGDSPFNELSNDWYFYTIIILNLFLLTVNLISTVVIGGVVISILDTVYTVLFARYIFLYRDYLDYKKKDINNKGNFDEIRANVKKTVDDVTDMVVDSTNELKEKVNDFIEENDIDDKVIEVKDKVVTSTKEIKDKIDDFIEENNIDEKVNDVKNKVVDSTKEIRDKIDDISNKHKMTQSRDSRKNGNEKNKLTKEDKSYSNTEKKKSSTGKKKVKEDNITKKKGDNK